MSFTTKPGRPGLSGSNEATGSRARVVGGAVGVALLGWVAVGPLAGVDLAVRTGSPGSTPQHVGPAWVLAISLLVALAAWGVLAVVERRSRQGRRTWTILALVVLVVSLSGPLTAGVTASAKVALALLHVAVAGVLIPLLGRTARSAEAFPARTGTEHHANRLNDRDRAALGASVRV